MLPIDTPLYSKDFNSMDTEPFARKPEYNLRRSTGGIKRTVQSAFGDSYKSETHMESKRFCLTSKDSQDDDFEDILSAVAGVLNTKTRLPPAPWENTDLLIYKNDFGPLPSNGISEVEFEKANQLYLRLCSGNGLFQIEGEEDFWTTILENGIKKILSRSPGRELLFKLADSGKKFQIAYWGEEGGQFLASKDPRDKDIIHINHNYSPLLHGRLPNGDISLMALQFHCMLFHELCHLCHYLDKDEAYDTSRRATLGDEWSNLCEQRGITGIGTLPLLDSDETVMNYNPFNENRYRASWGIAPRVNVITQSIKKSDLELEKGEVAHEPSDPTYQKNSWKKDVYFVAAARIGLIDDMREFLFSFPKYSQLIHHTTKETLLDMAVAAAIKFDNLPSFEFLIKEGGRPVSLYVNSPGMCTDPAEFEKELLWNLAFAVAEYGAPRIMNKLLSYPEVQSKISKRLDKNSILHKYIYWNCKYWRINSHILGNIKTMLKLGADPLQIQEDNTISFTWAAYFGATEVMELLFAGRNKIEEMKFWFVQMKTAICNDYPKAVIFLSKKGIINSKRKNGDSVAHEILAKMNSEIIQRLFKIDTLDFSAIGANGNTLLHSLMGNSVLSKEAKLDFAKFLLSKGVDGEAVNGDGKKYLQLVTRPSEKVLDDETIISFSCDMSLSFPDAEPL